MTSHKQYFNMLCDMGELRNILTRSPDLDTFLHDMVRIVARHLETDVCSIYLFEDASHDLVLRATEGLNPDTVGEIRLKIGEGLVGTAVEEMRPVLDNNAAQNPRFRAFPAAGEEAFEAFLALPMLRGQERIGALVVQRPKVSPFDDDHVVALKVVASQLASAIEDALAIINIVPAPEESHEAVDTTMRLIDGRVASAGYGHGPVSIIEHGNVYRENILRSLPDTLTADDFDQAISNTSRQLDEIQGRLSDQLPEMATMIFTAHQMMLMDTEFVGTMRSHVEAGTPPPMAVINVCAHYRELFESSSHDYMREKANDVEDLERRILHNFLPHEDDSSDPTQGEIVVAHDLFPSDIVKLASERIAGIVLVSGGVTSHVSIIARSLHLPMIIVNDPSLLDIAEGTHVLLDDVTGNVYIRPDEKVLESFRIKENARQLADHSVSDVRDQTLTSDGMRINLMANINLLSEISVAQRLKAEGVGLYRTEFPFLIRSNFPSEEEQVTTYRHLIKEMGSKEVTFRTLDIGGEKGLTYFDHGTEANPQLGLRSIRFSLAHKDIFRTQLRAILRAGAEGGKLRIMFPMISSVDEFLVARQMTLECVAELQDQGIEHHPSPAIGLMIELPSVIEIMDDLARISDFFSIGTNDFVQYLLGVDRTNEQVAQYYCGYHPAVLRALARVVTAAAAQERDISICGEMAHQLQFLPFFLGIGVRKLSVDPQFIPELQEAIRHITISDAVELAERLLSTSTIASLKSEFSSEVI